MSQVLTTHFAGGKTDALKKYTHLTKYTQWNQGLEPKQSDIKAPVFFFLSSLNFFHCDKMYNIKFTILTFLLVKININIQVET